MYNLLMCIPLIMIIVILLVKKVKFKEIVNGLFCGLISFIIIIILGQIINLFTGAGNVYGVNNDITISTIIISFLVGALPEEIGKFIGIKLTKPKDKASIFMNAMLVAGLFAFIEGFTYSSSGSQHSIISRLLLPGHYFFQIVMSMLMIKGFEKNKNGLYGFLGILAAMLCHQLFNTLNSIDFILYIFYAIGVATYAFIIYYLLKLDYKSDDKKYKLTWLKCIIVVFVLFMITSMFNAKFYKLNDTVNLSDKITVQPTSYECHEITGDFKIYDYSCNIKVTIDNQSDKDYTLIAYRYNLVNSRNTKGASSFRFEDDRDKWVVNQGETAEIEIHYDFKGDEPKFDSFQIISDNKDSYNFNLK